MLRRRARRLVAALAALVTAAGLVSCAQSGPEEVPVRVAWAAEVPPLDPAASDSLRSFAFLSLIYPTLFTIDPEDGQPVTELAASAQWTQDGVFTVVLKSGLRFANDNELTASDVEFSIERQLTLRTEGGAWRQLASLDGVEAVDATTIVFHLATPRDAGFPFVLAGPAGLILDEETFYADQPNSDDEILAAQPFAGPYALTQRRGDTLVLDPLGGFGGVQVAALPLELQTGADQVLAQRIVDGGSDIITGHLSAEAVRLLVADSGLDQERAASGRVRLLAFDLQFMPFGARTATPDAARATAIRLAAASLIDRDALAAELGADWIDPLRGFLPAGVGAAPDVVTATSGDGEGGPDAERAAAILAAAAVETPVPLTLHVASTGTDDLLETETLAAQLASDGLFEVTIVHTDAEALATARLDGEVQAVFTTVLPAVPDPIAYLAPFRSGSMLAPGFADAEFDALLTRQADELDPALRAATLLAAQNRLASSMPAIPVSQGVRVVFASGGLLGVELADSQPLDLTVLRH